MHEVWTKTPHLFDTVSMISRARARPLQQQERISESSLHVFIVLVSLLTQKIVSLCASLSHWFFVGSSGKFLGVFELPQFRFDISEPTG